MKILIYLCAYLVCFANPGFAQDSCEEYGEDYECPSTIEGYIMDSKWNFDNTTASCEDDLVGVTKDLIATGSKYIRYSENRSAVMIIGVSGTGKSTFAYFFAGDDSALVAYRKGPASLKKYMIKDCNGKIVGGLASGTIFPDLLYDNYTEHDYYDNPGFNDNRSPCIELANSYFMTNVTSSLDSVHFVITLDYERIRNEARDGIPGTLKSVMAFIPTIKNFGSSLTLIATKLDDLDSTDEEHVDGVIFMLNDAKNQLPEIFGGEELEKANFILDTFIKNRSVAIFRVPNECGPLSSIDLMQENKEFMRSVISRANFTSCVSSDFNLTLSGDTKNKVANITGTLYPDIRDGFMNLAFEIASGWESILSFEVDIFEKQKIADRFFNDANTISRGAKDAYNSEESFKPYFQKIGSLLKDTVPTMEKEIITFIDNYTSVLDFLEFMVEANPDTGNWKSYGWEIFNNLQQSIVDEIDFVGSIIDLFEKLSSVDIHYEDYGDYKKWRKDNPSVTSDTLSKFWEKFGSLFPATMNLIKFETIMQKHSKNRFDILNNLLTTTLSTTSFECETPQGSVVVYEDNYINFKNIFDKCQYSDLETVVILTLNTTFVDGDVIGNNVIRNTGINIVIISPRLIVEKGNATINLRGHTPETPEQEPCCGNTPGKKGDDGFDGGSFYAITAEMSGQYILNVICTGGKGADGQIGQEGNKGAAGDEQKVRNKENEDCAAWDHGWIQVRKYPNDCNEKDQTCHAGDNGVDVEVYGTVGRLGQLGGTGGKGGSGGLSGVCNVTCSACVDRFTLEARNGASGRQGVNGTRGAQGPCGHTTIYNIDDVLSGTKKCQVVEKKTVAPIPGGRCKGRFPDHVNVQSSETATRHDVKDDTVYHHFKSTSSNEYIFQKSDNIDLGKYKMQFKALAQAEANNPFLGKRLQSFASSL